MFDTLRQMIMEPAQLTQWYFLLPIAVGFIAYESWWRRWFGGKDLPKWLSWLDKRFFKHVLNYGIVFSLCHWVSGVGLYWSLYSALIVQIFWALAHGPWFDCGRGGMPDAKMEERYNKVWFAKILNQLFPKEHWYGHFYDFCGMLIRYTWPLFLLIICPAFSYGTLLLGEMVAVSYAVCHVAKEKELFHKLGPTDLTEYIAGGLTGFMLVIELFAV